MHRRGLIYTSLACLARRGARRQARGRGGLRPRRSRQPAEARLQPRDRRDDGAARPHRRVGRSARTLHALCQDPTPARWVTVIPGSISHGQGHETMYKILLSHRLGLDEADIQVAHSDTDLAPDGGGTYAREPPCSAAVQRRWRPTRSSPRRRKSPRTRWRRLRTTSNFRMRFSASSAPTARSH